MTMEKTCKPETYETRLKRCVRNVTEKYGKNGRYQPWGICKATIKPFEGKVSSCKPMPTKRAIHVAAKARRAR